MTIARLFSGVGALSVAIFLVACGDDTGGGGSGGQGGDASSSETVADAASTADAASSGDGSSSANGSSSTGGAFTCDSEGFEVANQTAADFGEGNGFYSSVVPGDPYDSFAIEWYEGLFAVGEETIIDANYSTCSLCVLVKLGCDGDTSVCEKTFLARSGTVVLESVTDDLVGSVRDVELIEVTIDEDYFSDPVPGGETYCVDELIFDTPVEIVDV